MKETMKTLKPQIESRTMERVESALKEVARAKDGKTISVRLDPPELGTVKIDVSLRDGALHARIVAETPQVTTLLKEKSQELVQIMRKLGLQVEKVSVAVGDHQESFNRNLHEFNSSAQQFGDKRGGQENGSSGNNRGRQSVGVNLAGLQRTTTTNVDDHWVA
jgi:flagellar hook-length control protein FliK